MSIEASITVTLAEVEVTDEYTVALSTRRKVTDLQPDEAVQLANELMEAAKDAEGALADDLARSVARAHGYDVAPICRECGEGKCGACNGQAVIEVRGEIEVHACGCAEVDHQVHGRES